MTNLTREQANRIIAVIEKDALGRGSMKTPEGTCAIGGLYEAIGGPLKTYDGHGAAFIRETVAATYGLTNKQTWELSNINDDHDNLTARRLALIALVESWVSA